MTGVYTAAARLMGMSDAVWRRHANPWSGYTRIVTILPLFLLAVWSRVWIGPWAWLAVALVVFWVWLNPRAFPEPRRFDAWISRGVMGERIVLEHRAEIAAHHLRMVQILSLLSLPGIVIMAWGLFALWWEGAVFGALLGAFPKIWFIDRMVWIQDDWVRAGRAVPGFEAEEA